MIKTLVKYQITLPPLPPFLRHQDVYQCPYASEMNPQMTGFIHVVPLSNYKKQFHYPNYTKQLMGRSEKHRPTYSNMHLRRFSIHLPTVFTRLTLKKHNQIDI